MAMELRGSLNLSKFATKPTSPKYYGRALVGGVEYDLKGWEKDGKDGPWISILFIHPDEKVERLANDFAHTPPKSKQATPSLNPVKKNYVDDDVPF